MEKQKILSMLRFCEPMHKHTTFRIGGPCDIWAGPQDLESLSEILKLCRYDSIPVMAVGNGSNLLVKDKGLKACLINLGSDSFKDIKIEDDVVKAGAGLSLTKMLNILCDNGLGGFEFLTGIPATVGGALAMNAGGSASISDFVEQVTVIDQKGQISDLEKKELVFRYRWSNLEKYIILRAKFKLKKSSHSDVRDKMKKYLAEKVEKQELDKPSAGCVFKNPEGDSAGRLIDASGLKGKNVGDAVISRKHANFIINKGNARCEDVLRLMDIIRDKVKKDHGVELEPEIKVL